MPVAREEKSRLMDRKVIGHSVISEAEVADEEHKPDEVRQEARQDR
jgi:hypothetical protein